MIDALVDATLVSLLRTVPGLTVVRGIEDNEPPLETPYVVVHSGVTKTEGRDPMFELVTEIEHVSISGQDTVASIETTMSAIDALLTTPPTPELLAVVETTGLSYLAWESIQRTQQDVGDRRRNVRELRTFAQLA